MGRIQGSVGDDALSCFAIGDIPGISMVIVGGQVVVGGRSEQTPPPAIRAAFAKGGQLWQ